MISTRDLSRLPDVAGLRRLLQSMAMLDAILCRGWEGRYYSFNSQWANAEQMGSMRDGQGDDFFAVFNSHGCFLKGFAHESPMSPYSVGGSNEFWRGLIESVPWEFAPCLSEPAFSIKDMTFCIWRRHSDATWQRGEIVFPPGPDPDGSEILLSQLDGQPETYRAWAEWYFDKPFLTLEMVRHIYDHKPLTNELVAALTQDLAEPLAVGDLDEDIWTIGYAASS